MATYSRQLYSYNSNSTGSPTLAFTSYQYIEYPIEPKKTPSKSKQNVVPTFPEETLNKDQALERLEKI